MKFLKRAQLPGLDTMGMVLLVWICALPFIGLLIAPVFGTAAALAAALALLIVLLLFCWGSCIPAAIRFYKAEKRKTVVSSETSHHSLGDTKLTQGFGKGSKHLER
ncbi:MAG: hypothetical protein K8L99_02945 [Anaerolineae bacterium]|nr:hypothetical protein [Anaerolineae bacterium]